MASTGLLASCSVYTPLQPSAPLLRDKGQVEVAGSVFLAKRLEGSVAYSPARHVLVRAAGGLRPGKVDTTRTYFRLRQFELGAGTYWPLSGQWLVGGLGGYGRGKSSRRFDAGGFESLNDSVTTYQYEARFHKVFGEVFAAYEGERTTMGLTYRLSQVRFPALTNNGIPINLRRMTRNEPMFFVRYWDREGVFPWAQLQLAVSLSWSADYSKKIWYEQPLRDLKEPQVLTSLGLVIYPHRFKKQYSTR
ncbi:hypothetical protein BXP70_14380 [Hymenobacter crusticola]|uniref:DUF2490 domain-containing protein n=1 Tax=Hymenobacter crusticola TaxID=1770526 RepID=A0A243WBW0_9BACT|nr:hypothetical protein BXP70_14380 [Hymenobacter crusticola]